MEAAVKEEARGNWIAVTATAKAETATKATAISSADPMNWASCCCSASLIVLLQPVRNPVITMGKAQRTDAVTFTSLAYRRATNFAIVHL